MDHHIFAQGSLVTDEIGIVSARYGDIRLQTVYQPVFQRRRDKLIPVGVTAFPLATRAGQPVAYAPYYNRLTDNDRACLDELNQALAILNFDGMGNNELWLLVDGIQQRPHGHDPLMHELDTMKLCLNAAGISPGQIVYRIGVAQNLKPVELARNVDTIRRQGMSIALDTVGLASDNLSLCTVVQPDIAIVEDRLIERLSGVPQAIRLLSILVSRLQKQGMRVLSTLTGEQEQSESLFACGIDYLQSPTLAPPAPAGFDLTLDPQPLNLVSLGGTVPMWR